VADIFISYSSQDRAIAQRFEAALTEAGYAVFRDQSTPAGQDWDSWIRGQLASARLTLVLWTRASVASPNVRHEAIIAREAGKLMPVMVDDLEPTDFPMGLFMVHALSIGRSERAFEEALPRFLDEVDGRLQTAPRTKKRRRGLRRLRRYAVGFGIGALVTLLAYWFVPWTSIGYMLSPDTPPVTRQQMRAAATIEAPARARIAAAIAAPPAASADADPPWAAAIFAAAAPEESNGAAGALAGALDRALQPDCGCYAWNGARRGVGNAWALLAASALGRPSPRLIAAIVAAQTPDGWWPASLDAAPIEENTSMHATAMLAIALAEARRTNMIAAADRPRIDTALERARAWLDRGPSRGWLWSDFPRNDRRTQSEVFAAMALVAGRLAGAPPGQAADAFLASADSLPPASEAFDAGVRVRLAGGAAYLDEDRYAVSPWIGAAAAFAYPRADAAQRRRLRSILDHWLAVDLNDPALARQDWIAAETIFLRRLAFRQLVEDRPRRSRR
jgi:hypothetical protein